MLSTGTGASCCQRQKERSLDLKDNFYQNLKDIWSTVESALNSEW